MADLPITRSCRGGYVLKLGADERLLISRLLGELRALLLHPPEAGSAADATKRLFPVVHPGDAAMESEYQRLMRDELVASRLSAINAVDALLVEPGRKVSFDEEQLVSFMQAVNAVRLVLGTLLDVSEDDDGADETTGTVNAPEYQLYRYLSWILDSAVHALSGI